MDEMGEVLLFLKKKQDRRKKKRGKKGGGETRFLYGIIACKSPVSSRET